MGLILYSVVQKAFLDQMDAKLKVYTNIANTGFTRITDRDTYYQIVSAQGQIVNQSEPGAPTPSYKIYTMEEAAAINAKPFEGKGRYDDTKWRMMIISPLEIRGDSGSNLGRGYVLIAITYDNYDESLNRVAMVILLVGLIVVVIGTSVAYLTVTRSFKPLVRVEKTAATIAAGDLSQRVQIQNPATEIGKLSESLNTMLAHIEVAFDARTESERRMRRFIADASHELRTPLVTIRGFSELYRHGALSSKDDVGTAMGRIESEAKRMGALVEDLLMLARLDEQRDREVKPIDLLILGNDAAVDARASAPDRKVTVVGLDQAPAINAPTVGDEAKIRQVVANLITNALRYSPPGSPLEVAVGVSEIDGQKYSILEIRDHGPGIAEAEKQQIFERFYRAESSRNRDTGGSGLGLAIVSAIISNHQGKVLVKETAGGGATLSVRLPYQSETD